MLLPPPPPSPLPPDRVLLLPAPHLFMVTGTVRAVHRAEQVPAEGRDLFQGAVPAVG